MRSALFYWAVAVPTISSIQQCSVNSPGICCTAGTTNWTIVNTTGAIVIGRYGHTTVYDDSTDSLFLFAGYHAGVKDNTYAISSKLYRLNVSSQVWYVFSLA